MTIKVPLADQIREAELHLAKARQAAAANPALKPRLDAAHAIVISLHTFAGLYDTDRMEGRERS